MSVRDRELELMTKYAQSLGIRVSFRKHKLGYAGAEWFIDKQDQQTIILYTWPNQSKTTLVLNFLHELAHALAFVRKGRRLSISVLNAISAPYGAITEEQRRIVYKEEYNDSKYRWEIVKDLGIGISKWKIELDIALDRWVYYRWWKTTEFPTIEELAKKRKQLRRKYNVN